MSERTAVFAEPAISKIEITTLTGTPVVDLVKGDEYLLKVGFQNNSTNAIPSKTAYVKVGFGLGLEKSPDFILEDAGYSEFVKYSYQKLQGRQALVAAELKADMPANFSGELVFKVKATALADTAASVNFLVYNQNPAYILADTEVNNSAAVEYKVK